MSWISLLLLVKIVVTLVLVAIPFLFVSKEKLEIIVNIKANSPQFFRLYGVAIFALLVGYSFGIPLAESGVFPWGVVSMGVVSNGGAAFILVSAGLNSKNRVLALFFLFITLGLVLSILFSQLAVQKAW
ncbi:MAG: hypothetical protein KZQ75_15485 [Candidatus Thiodiazotropha sp. (ex Myrtea spinifera)]|nr:hypothetical protein [Candidatus Thiodiazotropha sp. (ex Myrtea spinifera)]